MNIKYIFLFYLIKTITAELQIPAVYEQIDEGDLPNSENSARIPRHPNKQKYDYRSFNFQNAQAQQAQMDQQKLRYARQQQVDNYMRAYHQQVKQAIENSKRISKARKIEKIGGLAQGETAVTRKVLIPKQQKSEAIQTSTITQGKIAQKTPMIGYKVFEDIDQEVQPSQKRISRVNVAQDDLLNYPIPEGYFSKNSHGLPPKIIQEDNKAVPQSYGLGAYSTVPKTELDALTTLLNKPATVQLNGLNQLLNQKHVYTYSYPEEVVTVPQKAIKQYTPIEEHVVDVANSQTKPNVLVQPIQIYSKPQKYLGLAGAQETQKEKLPALENVSIYKTNSTNRRKREVDKFQEKLLETNIFPENFWNFSRKQVLNFKYNTSDQTQREEGLNPHSNKYIPKFLNLKSSHAKGEASRKDLQIHDPDRLQFDLGTFVSKNMDQNSSISKREASKRVLQKKGTLFLKKLISNQEVMQNSQNPGRLQFALDTFISKSMGQKSSISKRKSPKKLLQKREANIPSVPNKTNALFVMEAPNLTLDYEITTLKIQDLEHQSMEEISEEVSDNFRIESSAEEYPDYSQEFQDDYELCQKDFAESSTTVLPEISQSEGAERRAFNLDKNIYKVQRAMGMISLKKPGPILRRKYRRPKLNRRPSHKRKPKHLGRKPKTSGPPIHYMSHPFEIMEIHEVPPPKDYTDYYTEFSSEANNFDQVPSGYIYQTPDSTIHINMNSHDNQGPLTFPNQGHYGVHEGLHSNHLQEPEAEEGKNIIVINNSNDNHNHGGNSLIKGGHGGKGKLKKGRRGHRGHGHRKMSQARLLTLDKKLDNVLGKLMQKDILDH